MPGRCTGDYVDEGLSDPRSPFENLVAQLYLGSEAWIAKLRPVIEEKPRSDDHPRAQREAALPELPVNHRRGGRSLQRRRDSIRHGHGGNERMLVAWLGCYEGMHRLRSIAASLRLKSSGRASDLIRLCDRELDRDPLLRLAADHCCERLRGSPPPGLRPIVPGSRPSDSSYAI